MHGIEWIVEAWGCSAASLRDRAPFSNYLMRLSRLEIWPISPVVARVPGQWRIHRAGPSIHLPCHTFPEHGSLCLNLFCCVPRAEWKFDKELRDRLNASEVFVRSVHRSYGFSGIRAAVK
jgi:S-adenosylmethionine decarboxylase